MLNVYCYNRCTTCRKALKWLQDHGFEHTVTDIRSSHPDMQTLRQYYTMSGLPLKRFFNTSGLQYKALDLKNRLPGMTADEQFALLASDGMLVKRPILVSDDFVLTGFREAEYEAKLT